MIGQNSSCPRCGQRFHCGAADMTPCACSGLVLSAELRARLRERYAGCLCLSCLEVLARAGASEAPEAASQPLLPLS